MGALAPVSPWMPEDDLLLKNAVEAGASLESLAKGAVQFSRRFTIRELRDRWHSLLYDTVVSAEASFSMTELERSNPNFPTKFGRTGNSKENKTSFGKRNAERVRTSYYSLRKKIRSEPFGSLDLNFLVPPNGNHFIGDGNESHLGFEESHLDIIHNAFPEILTEAGCVTGFHNPIEDNNPMKKDNVRTEVSHMVADNLTCTEKGTSACNLAHADPKLKGMVSHEPKSTTPSTDCFLAELSHSLFNDADHQFMDVDGKDMIDKSYYDGLSSLLVNPVNNASQDHMPNSTDPGPEQSTAPNSLRDVSVGGNQLSELEGTNAMSTSGAKTFSDAPALDRHPEMINGVICCTLNVEDTEVPCNDGIFTSNHRHPMSVSTLAKCNFKEPGNPTSTSVRGLPFNKERTEGYLVHMQKNLKQYQASSQEKPEMGQLHQVSEYGVKIEFLGSDCPQTTSKTACISSSVSVCRNTLQPTVCKDVNKEITLIKHESEKPFIVSNAYKSYPEKDGGTKLEQDVLAAHNPHTSYAEEGSINIADPELEINPAALCEHLIESDDDLPNYSDIEAMILDMDLDPDDQDIFELEVLKYQNEETKRAIIRLEQAANCYMQRAIASHCAFALLYGRHSRHYIRKPEVLLGRSTEDFEVDIDLGREKRGNKISRRQAIIRLDKDGSFHMKNLGKYPISVNDKEVDPGQSLVLNSDCLVEIRGMPYIFKTNQTRVKECLDSIGKANRVG